MKETDYEKCGGALWKPQVIFTRCLRCGRKLKTPEAQERGYGNVCWNKHLTNEQKANAQLPLF